MFHLPNLFSTRNWTQDFVYARLASFQISYSPSTHFLPLKGWWKWVFQADLILNSVVCHLWSTQPHRHHVRHIQLLELHSLGRDIGSPGVYLTCTRSVRAKLLTCDWCLLASYTITLSEEKSQPLGILRIDEKSEGGILVGFPRPRNYRNT